MRTLLHHRFNRVADRIVRPQMSWQKRPVSSFHLCGCTGLVLAIAIAAWLATRQHLSLWVVAGTIVAAVITFPSVVMITKILTGEERIIYYHHEIAVVLVTTLLLFLLREPPLPYLDLTILGIGTFLALGRVGCFMVGCCHGRPHSWGVCYRREHTDAGFPPYYVGVRLFPVQLVESLWVLCAVIVGSYFVIRGDPPGAALAWYVVAYDLGRFTFEFMRGDPERPYVWGFSQPQWISVILLWCVAGAELAGILALHRWHLAAAAGLTLSMIVIALKRRFQRAAKFLLLHPRHVREIAEMIDLSNPLDGALPSCRWTVFARPASPQQEIRVGCTSLGILVSASKTRLASQLIEHFALSGLDGEMSEESARSLFEIITRLARSENAGQLVRGKRGVFHLLIRQGA
ncbi:MAG TPA: prolipoprotein diacylglyceryl transferase family protein [Blastocatellia bacterium]|nr:prolipoprotein diacylglyceryl transferase family protein [Blastocatellia bacterium]